MTRPVISIGIQPWTVGAPIPGEILAALSVLNAKGGGSLRVHLLSRADETFFHYMEFAPTFLEAAEADAKLHAPEHERSVARAGEVDQPRVVAGEDAVHDGGALEGLQHEANGDRDLGPLEADGRIRAFDPAALNPDQCGEVRDWSALSAFLTPERFGFGWADGCLVKAPSGRFLAVFFPIPADGGAR